jgi:hypothetical protein
MHTTVKVWSRRMDIDDGLRYWERGVVLSAERWRAANRGEKLQAQKGAHYDSFL